VTPASPCPAGAKSVTYGKSAGSFKPANQLLTSVTRAGKVTTYAYNNRDHLNCVKEPGRTTCRLQTSYAACPDDPQEIPTQSPMYLRDYVVTQQDAGGKIYSFSYDLDMCPKWKSNTDSDYRPFTQQITTMIQNGSAITVVNTDPSGLPLSIVDPLQRSLSYQLSGGLIYSGAIVPDATIYGVSAAEGNGETYIFDARGNATKKTIHGKPGSGSDFEISAVYPATCANRKTCNKPLSTSDARHKTSNFTYSPDHGGVLTEEGPAVDGVHPVKRYAYFQKYAWVKNAAGGYSQASSPVWLLAEERICRNSATVGNGCAGGPVDEVVTSYDYGPSSGAVGNNLLLRGKTVTSDGNSPRTCFGYDRHGNRIWESSPRAALASCY
jgi:YD repeat-containing protein